MAAGPSSAMPQKQVLVIGAGIIGLSAAHHLVERGHSVSILDRDPEGDRCSHGNAGGIAMTDVMPASSPSVFLKIPRWLMDPLGPLALRWSHLPALLPWLIRFSKVSGKQETQRIAKAIASINLRTYDDLVPLLKACGIENELHRKGAIAVYETDAAFRADMGEMEMRRRYGITCDLLSGDMAREMEPALGPIVRHAYHTPQWSIVSDPKRIHNGIMATMRQRGVAIMQGTAAMLVPTTEGVRVETSDGKTHSADEVVVTAGAWSGILAKSIGDRVLLESERGYNTTIPSPGITVGRQIVFAERKFVATPLAIGLRIGGAVEFGGLDAKPNYKRSEALVTLARKYFPGLNEAKGTVWCGHRPCTPDSLPVIGRSPRAPNVIYAFGHGHYGLTQSATTGRLVADIVSGTTPPIDLKPFSINRF
jgi:D-amino-acid dehydrogenase